MQEGGRTSWLQAVAGVGRHWLSLLGAALVTSSALTMLAFWIVEAVSDRPIHPYVGIIVFLILPAIFVLGLLLIPLGSVLRRRAAARAGAAGPPLVTGPALARVVGIVAALTIVNLLLLGVASVRGVEYMDSSGFCGTTCHTVMQPQYTAFLRGSHAPAGCAECHIGPGARAFLNAKLSGVRQVYHVATGTYPRPIPAPVEDLRPADETCGNCHDIGATRGSRLRVRTIHAEDEANTPSYTVLMLKVGGRTPVGVEGIHGAHGAGRITYVADRTRQVIPRVTYTDPQGTTVEYVSKDAAGAVAGPMSSRVMDCTDCHNRTGHAFSQPHRALDAALADGRISRRLPWIKREGLRLLRGDYANTAEATRAIDADLQAFYATQPGAAAAGPGAVQQAIRAVQDIYAQNVFPAMDVTWGTYPDHSGHEDFPGCFRCHDGTHEAPQERVISQDCDACHTIVATDEPEPPVLSQLGLAPSE